MFWQVILFILITLGVILLRAFTSAAEQEDDMEYAIIGFFLGVGLLFYAPFAIKWGLNFTIGFTGLSYWSIMGLYVLRNTVFGRLNKKED